MKETLINGKYKLMLPEHRAARPEWQTGWEVERIEHMLSNLKKGDLVLDIGTEEGDISALLAQRTENIVLFEPNEKVWPNIRAIWEANKLEMPRLMLVGFASNETDAYLRDFSEAKWPKCAYGELIGDHGFKELINPGDISRFSVDGIVLANPVRLITMDVEGSEFEVLKGAQETIKRDKPHIYVSVHPEFMFRMFGQYTAELVKFVEDLGYKHEVLAFDHEFHFYFKPL